MTFSMLFTKINSFILMFVLRRKGGGRKAGSAPYKTHCCPRKIETPYYYVASLMNFKLNYFITSKICQFYYVDFFRGAMSFVGGHYPLAPPAP